MPNLELIALDVLNFSMKHNMKSRSLTSEIGVVFD